MGAVGTTMRVLLGVVTFVVATAVVAGLGAGPAGASCEGPGLVLEPFEAARGATVTVVGRAFGDNCYDTGPPPPGQGALGRPRQDIDLVVIQGDVEIVVAEGGAGDDYGFEVDIVVPPELAPGPAWLVPRITGLPSPDPDDLLPPNLTITDAPPTGAGAAVADFTPAAAADESGATDDGDDDDGSSNRTWLIVAGAFVVVTAAGALIAARAR